MVDITYWMNKEPAAIQKGSDVLSASKIMADLKTDAVIVVENNKPVGIFTLNDLVRKVVSLEKDPKSTTIDSVMTSNIEVILKSKPYQEVLNHMKDKNFQHLPVVDEKGDLLGLVTLRSLIKH